MALLAFSFSLEAQQFVSTVSAKRNVLLEEFTGRNCGWCPDGHIISNGIAAAHPDHYWAINIHSGSYSPTSYPNLNTTDGNTICGSNGFSCTSFPGGVINRSTATSQGRNLWAGQANTQFNQDAECNVDGMVIINPNTREANITVEVYYTANSSQSTNYLTVAMVQDSIWGSQANGNTNPAQWNGSEYCHMHVLRDVINQSAWGDEIAPTTQGTLITQTYTYEIPQQIGASNAVAVDLDNIHFIAFVTEGFQGKPTRPVLNVNELEVIQGSEDPISPFLKTVAQEPNATCSHSKIINATVMNGGTETLSSMTIETVVEGQTFTTNWEGSLNRFDLVNIDIPVEVPFGTYNATVSIVSANGQPFDGSKTIEVNCMEWVDLNIEGAEEELKLELMQDKFGNQITWKAVSSNGTVLASGGPYGMLAGGTSTQIHIEHFNVYANECVKFTIYDNVGNGICCDYGHGYFILYDSNNNVIFGDEDDGEFGSEASILLSVKNDSPITIGETHVEMVSHTDADFITDPIEYVEYPIEVGFEYQKEGGEVHTVVGIINEFHKIMASVSDLEYASTYTVRAYAVSNGITYYGIPTTFTTWTEGVNELENSLKLYPNPASEVLNLVGEGMNKVEIYNAMGQCVIAEEVNGNATISTSALNNGVYFVRIYAESGEMVTRNFSVVR